MSAEESAGIDERVFASDVVLQAAESAPVLERPSKPSEDFEPHVAVTVNSIPPAPPPEKSPSSHPPPSRRSIAGRYRLDSRLAEGGMGIVYSGWHVTLDQPVAVKVIRKELVDNADAVQRFIEEARALAQLRGPHVAQVLDAGIEDGSPFIVMELLQGRDLRTLLEQHGQMPPERAVELVREACEAVAEAHAKGIVHRDLKPENLFLADAEGGDSTLKVIDFGISARRGVDGAYREQALGPGSPEYMAPEQLLPGSPVDHRADIWSLGIVLFELLAGSVPFSGESQHEICSGVVAAEAPTLKSRGVEVPEGLEQLIHRCLSKSADDRFTDALELALALAPYRALLESQPPRRIQEQSRVDTPANGERSDEIATPIKPLVPSWLVDRGARQIGIGVFVGFTLGVLLYLFSRQGPDERGQDALHATQGQSEPSTDPQEPKGEVTGQGPKVLPVLDEDQQAAAREDGPSRAVRAGGAVPGRTVAAPVPVPAPATADQKIDSELDGIGEAVAPLVDNPKPSGEEAVEARYALAASDMPKPKPESSPKPAEAASKPVAPEAAPADTPARASFPDPYE